MYVVRKQLTPREGSPADTRYNPDCDCVETTTDGGETWNPNDGGDPRVNPAYLMPPNTAPDVRCAAAAGMVENVRRVVNAGITGGGVVGIGNVLIAFLVLPLGLLWLMIATIAAAIAGIGGFALNAAFTEDVYDFLLCAFYNHVDAEGRIDAVGYAAMQADMTAEFDNDVIDALLSAMWVLHGAVGFSNAGVLYADAEAVCECAPPICVTFDEFSYPYTFINFPDTSGSGSVDTGFGDPSPSGKGYEIDGGTWNGVEIEFPDPVVVTAVSFYYYYHDNLGVDVLVRRAEFLDEGGTIVYSLSSVFGAPQNAWTLWTLFGAVYDEPVKKVRVYLGVSADETFEGENWIDNICIETL